MRSLRERLALLPNGDRWADDLPPPLIFVHRGARGMEDFIACRICHKHWRHVDDHPVDSRNVRWLIEHVWSHAQLPIGTAAEVWARPAWQREDLVGELTEQQAAARWVSWEGRQSRAQPKRRR